MSMGQGCIRRQDNIHFNKESFTHRISPDCVNGLNRVGEAVRHVGELLDIGCRGGVTCQSANIVCSPQRVNSVNKCTGNINIRSDPLSFSPTYEDKCLSIQK